MEREEAVLLGEVKVESAELEGRFSLGRIIMRERTNVFLDLLRIYFPSSDPLYCRLIVSVKYIAVLAPR